MIQMKTRLLSLDEFLELHQWCDENNVEYVNDVLRRERNVVIKLFINDQELVTFAQLKWDATVHTPVELEDYILSSDC